MKNDDDGFLDMLNEATFNPVRWSSALDLLAQLAGATGAALSIREDRRYRIYTSDGMNGVVGGAQDIGEHVAGERAAPSRFADHAYFDFEELDRGTHWRDALLGQEQSDDTATSGDAIGAVHVSFDGLDPEGGSEGAMAVCGRLSRPIIRALALQTRSRERSIGAVVDNLALAGVAAAVINQSGMLRAANSLFVEQVKTHAVEHRGLLRFFDRLLQNKFLNAVVSCNTDAGVINESIGVAGTKGESHFVVHLVRLLNLEADKFERDLLIILGSDQSRSIIGENLLKSMFDLTPAESRLTRMLLEGESLETSALKLHVSVMTMRVHLRGVFAKVGVDRQTELIRTLQGLGLPSSHLGTL